MGLIELLVVIILLFWLASFVPAAPYHGASWVHFLLVLVIVLVLLRVLGVV
jgi:hypothetical protein